jgi:hypothetical protein
MKVLLSGRMNPFYRDRRKEAHCTGIRSGRGPGGSHDSVHVSSSVTSPGQS